MSQLAPRHMEELRASAITDEVIAARGWESVTNPRSVPREYFADYQRLPGLLIPIRNMSGNIVNYQLKPDNPRRDQQGKVAKYESAKNGTPCLDVHPMAIQKVRNIHAQLWITEGAKKVDSAISNGITAVVGLSGVWNWMSDKTRLADWDEIPLKGRDVVLAFDSDVMTSDKVRTALERCGAWLSQVQRANVQYLIMPNLPNGEKCGLDDWFASGRTRLELDDLIVDELPGSEFSWDDPIDMDPVAGPPPPMDHVPGIIGEWAGALSEETQTPADLALAGALAGVSAADRGRTWVRAGWLNWDESTNVLVVPCAEPAERKSAVLRRTFAPHREFEQSCNEQDAGLIADYQSKLRVLDSQLAAAEKDLARANAEGYADADLARKSVLDERNELVAEAPVETQIIVDDITPESLKQLMAEQQGNAIAAVSGESAFLENTIGGRYSGNKGAPNLDPILKGHPREHMAVNRRHSGRQVIDSPCLTMCVMTQPVVFESMGDVTEVTRRGVAARFLAVFPPSLLGFRNQHPAPVPAAVDSRWNKAIQRILSDPAGPRYLQLSDGARASFEAYRAWHEPNLRRDNPMYDIQGWFGKSAGTVLRLAGLFHISVHEQPKNEKISADTMESAIALTNYFTEHAKVMYRLMAGHRGQSSASIVLDALRRHEGESITSRELNRHLRGRAAFQAASDLKAPLDMLEENGWIRRDRITGPKGGRPSEVIHLHPEIHTQKAHKPPSPRTIGSIGPFGYENHDAGDNAGLDPTGTDGPQEWEV